MSEVLQKTNSKSHFRHFHNKSKLADQVFDKRSDVEILQIMKIDNEHYLAELVDKSDK